MPLLIADKSPDLGGRKCGVIGPVHNPRVNALPLDFHERGELDSWISGKVGMDYASFGVSCPDALGGVPLPGFGSTGSG